MIVIVIVIRIWIPIPVDMLLEMVIYQCYSRPAPMDAIGMQRHVILPPTVVIYPYCNGLAVASANGCEWRFRIHVQMLLKMAIYLCCDAACSGER